MNKERGNRPDIEISNREKRPSLPARLIVLGTVGISALLYACGEEKEASVESGNQITPVPTASATESAPTESPTPTEVIFETPPPVELSPAPREGEPLISRSLPQAGSWGELVEWFGANGGILADNTDVRITIGINTGIPENGTPPAALATARKAQSLEEATSQVQPYLDELCDKTGVQPPEGEFLVQTNTETAKGRVSITCSE